MGYKWNDKSRKDICRDWKNGELDKPNALKEGDTIFCGYGLEIFVLTPEDIKALQDGKPLNFSINCNEYGGLLVPSTSLE